ncbi:hypothetical protein [Halorussus aquaticus]|uniref:Uncharacterized protein n=1 Tax=Halorussus aquaticus TaxID=2953748 RepID=A0ABD5Q5U5_9EURY|nr:hypothetical protein [Halorussus aquaticus]
MDADPDAIRERLQVVHLDEPLSVSEEAVLYAEDPQTGCIGLGEVEAEAVGNAVSVVVRYERDERSGPPYVKAPGRVVRKSWGRDRTGVLSRVRDLL